MDLISEAAIDDIARIASDNWRCQGSDRAQEIAEELFKTIESLTSSSRSSKRFGPGWRYKNSDGIFVFYLEREEGELIVYAIFQEREDWGSLIDVRSKTHRAKRGH